MHIFDPRFAAYAAVASLLIVTPGPDTALVTRNALLAGRRAAAFTALGIGAGSVLWAVASVLGVAVLLEQSVVAFTAFKLAGAAYLCFLGLRALLARSHAQRRVDDATTSAPSASRLGDRSALRQGLVGNLLNPKAGAIFATVFPQFVNPGDSAMRLVLMLLAYEVILLVWLNLYGYAISRAGRSAIGERVRAIATRVTGVVLIALGVRLAIEQR
jgi:threonine/homoserine/homoserine lactone efflux protein